VLDTACARLALDRIDASALEDVQRVSIRSPCKSACWIGTKIGADHAERLELIAEQMTRRRKKRRTQRAMGEGKGLIEKIRALHESWKRRRKRMAPRRKTGRNAAELSKIESELDTLQVRKA